MDTVPESESGYNMGDNNDAENDDDSANSNTYRENFDVVIAPDVNYGLGLRLDNQNDRIIVMNFKKHPVTNLPMSVESSGLVQVCIKFQFWFTQCIVFQINSLTGNSRCSSCSD